MDMISLLEKISVPRPNHSDQLQTTAEFLKDLLTSWGIPFSIQEFPLRPYMLLIVGAAVFLMAAGLAFSVYRKKPWAALALAIAIPAVLVLEFELFVPVTSWIHQKPAENIIINFTSPGAQREILFAAHYDSKTDFWDHIQRARVYRFIPLAFLLGFLLALYSFLARRKESLSGKAPRMIALGLSGLLVGYMALLALGFGGFVLVPRQYHSFGAVDNGGAVVSLLALAKNLHEGKTPAGSSNVTILLTAGEEVSLQGAHYYVRKYIREAGGAKALPRFLVNLELAGQCGNLFYAQKVGVFLKYYDASPELVERAGKAWKDLTGRNIGPEKSITDDSQRFMAAGVPSITIGHDGLPGLGQGGFHCEKDSMARVDPENLKLMVRVLGKIIEGFR